MSRPKGAFTLKIDPQAVRLLAAIGKTEAEAAKFINISLRTFVYRKMTDKNIAEAWRTGKEELAAGKKLGNKKMPRIFKTPNYISRRIAKNPENVVNVFENGLINVFTENFNSFDGLSFREIVKKQLIYFAERTRK